MALLFRSKQLAELLQMLPGLVTRKPSTAALHLASALVNYPHAFSASLDSTTDDPETRLRKGLVALLTFDLHFQQFKAKEIQPQPAQVKYIFRLIMKEAGVNEDHVAASEVRMVISELRLQRRHWLCREKTGPKTNPDKLLDTLLKALDRSIRVSDGGRLGLRAHHNVGRLPMPHEKDWPRHLATRILQAVEIKANRDDHMSSLLRVRGTEEQIDREVLVFFQAHDSVSEVSASQAMNKLKEIPGKLSLLLRPNFELVEGSVANQVWAVDTLAACHKAVKDTAEFLRVNDGGTQRVLWKGALKTVIDTPKSGVKIPSTAQTKQREEQEPGRTDKPKGVHPMVPKPLKSKLRCKPKDPSANIPKALQRRPTGDKQGPRLAHKNPIQVSPTRSPLARRSKHSGQHVTDTSSKNDSSRDRIPAVTGDTGDSTKAKNKRLQQAFDDIEAAPEKRQFLWGLRPQKRLKYNSMGDAKPGFNSGRYDAGEPEADKEADKENNATPRQEVEAPKTPQHQHSDVSPPSSGLFVTPGPWEYYTHEPTLEDIRPQELRSSPHF